MEDLPQAVEVFYGKTDVLEETFEQAFLERSTRVDRDGHTTAVARSPQGEVAAALVGLLKPKPPQDDE